MPNWIPITASDLNDARAAKLVEALRTKALAAGQTDPVPRAVETVVAEVRAAIGFSGRYILDATAANIPGSLKDLAVQRVIRVAKQRLLMAFAEVEAKDEELYQRRLEQLTAGKWPVETADSPLTPAPVQSASTTPRITPRTLTFRREDGEGS